MESTATAVRDAQQSQKYTVKKSKKKSKNKKDNGKATEGSTPLKGDKEHVTDVGLSEKLTQQLHISDSHSGHCNGVNGVASNHNQEDGIDATPTLNGHHTEHIHAAADKANRHVVAPAISKSNGSKSKEHTVHTNTNVQSPAAATALENGFGSASKEQHVGKKKQGKNGKQAKNRKQQENHMASTQPSPPSPATIAVAIKSDTQAAPEDDEAGSKAASAALISTSSDSASATAAVSNTAKQSIATTIDAAAVATTTTMTNPTTAAKGIAVSEPSPLSSATTVATVPTPETPLDLSNVHIEYKEYESELQMHDIMRLIQAELSEPYSIYTYRYFIYNWPKLCFLAAHGNEYVGAIVCKLDLHMNVKRGYIAMLAVRKEYRKLKIGTTLVQKAIEAMLADNAAEVVLETEMRNVPALRLYENLGFVRDKRLFRYYLNGVDALRLKLWFR